MSLKLSNIALLAVMMASASGAEPEGHNTADPPEQPDDSSEARDTGSKDVVTCPCADDYAAAVAAYEARPGGPMRPQWDKCSMSPDDKVERYASMSKFDALTPSDQGRRTMLFLTADEGRTLGVKRWAACSAWVHRDAYHDNSSYGPVVSKKNLSAAELSACKALIEVIAKCPQT